MLTSRRAPHRDRPSTVRPRGSAAWLLRISQSGVFIFILPGAAFSKLTIKSANMADLNLSRNTVGLLFKQSEWHRPLCINYFTILDTFRLPSAQLLQGIPGLYPRYCISRRGGSSA